MRMGDYPGGLKTLNLCYLAEIDEENPKPKLSDESRSCKWVANSAIANLQTAFPWVKDAAAKI